MNLPFVVLAERAAEVLLAKLLDGTPLPELVRVPGSLIRRHSCGCTIRHPEELALASNPISLEAEQEGFTQVVLNLAGGGHTLDSALSTELRVHAGRIATHLRAIVRNQTGLSATDIRDAWQKLLTVAHEVETVETLLSLVEETAARWLRAEGSDGNGERPLQSALRSLRFELMRAWRVMEQARRR